MSTALKKKSRKSKRKPEKAQQPRSLAIAEKGIRTGSDFAGMMSTLMSDVISGRVSPQIANAAVNAGGKLLKVVEMQIKFGKPTATSEKRDLLLSDVATEPTAIAD